MTTDDWWTKAACQGEDTEIFFPQTPAQERAAKAICNTCPVKTQCGHYAATHTIYGYPITGIWGGKHRGTTTKTTT
ncbi:WhiB family transcriptional regulator [Bifidobacterium biavatii]|uniref:Transcription factor WhiB n=1 Tax=Bifidobacterium biavatii DSM 23969 TaxID=1437608 RepID=A0A086ZTU5_9BIFI|nr:WhiB family transcriptional regulator [Bifidobacterium biavatii]KFI49945.1 transcription factor WhiB [Bifidobacterium biavatii DSM 23969]